jgi:uncharacterized protein YjiS (DUF1127 family)
MANIFGHSGADTLNGGISQDTVFGGSRNDTLNGGSGNDTLFGGTGNDHLNGDAGKDRRSMFHRFVRKLGRGRVSMKLEDLDDRMLLDIGITRHDLEFIRRKW